MEIKNDLISRAAALEYLMTNMGWYDEDGYQVDDSDDKRAIITDLVNGIPAADAAPVKHGRWLYKDRHRKTCRQYTGYDDMGEEHTITVIEESEGKEPYCSECGAQAAESFMKYCPRCGAKMDEANQPAGLYADKDPFQDVLMPAT